MGLAGGFYKVEPGMPLCGAQQAWCPELASSCLLLLGSRQPPKPSPSVGSTLRSTKGWGTRQ